MKPEDVRAEIRHLHIALEGMGGNPSAVEEYRSLERRIMELASTERDARADELRETWCKRHPEGEACPT